MRALTMDELEWASGGYGMPQADGGAWSDEILDFDEALGSVKIPNFKVQCRSALDCVVHWYNGNSWIELPKSTTNHDTVCVALKNERALLIDDGVALGASTAAVATAGGAYAAVTASTGLGAPVGGAIAVGTGIVATGGAIYSAALLSKAAKISHVAI